MCTEREAWPFFESPAVHPAQQARLTRVGVGLKHTAPRPAALRRYRSVIVEGLDQTPASRLRLESMEESVDATKHVSMTLGASLATNVRASFVQAHNVEPLTIQGRLWFMSPDSILVILVQRSNAATLPDKLRNCCVIRTCRSN